jgi:hypothetical protein
MRPISLIVVKRAVRTVVVWLSIVALFATTEVAEAGPFEISSRQSGARSRTRKRSRDRTGAVVSRITRLHRAMFRMIKTSSDPVPAAPNRHDVNEAPPSDASKSQTSGGPAPAAPNGHNVRAAKAARPAKKGKSGLLYGTPVPGKQGLVTSPFSPDNGYIDVRSFPPGTEVKDPYTGKIFLTP